MKDLSIQTLWLLEDKARYPTTLREEHLLEESTEVFNGGDKLKSDLHLENDPTVTASHNEGATTMKENLQALLDHFGIL